jgi:malonate decarboxylase gamma subunit
MTHWQEVCKRLFPEGHAVVCDNDVLSGSARAGAREIAVIGCANQAYIGVEMALALARAVLDVLRDHPGRPILLMIDTLGQRLSRRDELLGINGYLAHLGLCLELARTRGHRIISLAYGEAVSGGFLASGMLADATYALHVARIQVMNLPAMARITRIPLERLEALSRTSPVFAPGVENFHRLGGISAVWSGRLAAQLCAALEDTGTADNRRALGSERGGRTHAGKAALRVRTDD